MTGMLSDAQVQQFQTDGYLVLPEAFSDAPAILERFRGLVAKSNRLEGDQSMHWNNGGWCLATDACGNPIPGRLHKIQGLFVEEPTELELAQRRSIITKVCCLV